MQEVTNGNDDAEEIENDTLGTVPKIKESKTTSSLSTKQKHRTTTNKVLPKPQPAMEKKSVQKDYFKEDDRKEKKWNNKRTIKCPFAGNYKKKELTGLLEEQIVGNLDFEYFLGA